VPQISDCSDFKRKQLLTLVRSGNSPFHRFGMSAISFGRLNNEENLENHVTDIPVVFEGSSNYASSCLQSSLLQFMMRPRLGGV